MGGGSKKLGSWFLGSLLSATLVAKVLSSTGNINMILDGVVQLNADFPPIKLHQKAKVNHKIYCAFTA